MGASPTHRGRGLSPSAYRLQITREPWGSRAQPSEFALGWAWRRPKRVARCCCTTHCMYGAMQFASACLIGSESWWSFFHLSLQHEFGVGRYVHQLPGPMCNALKSEVGLLANWVFS